MPWYAPWSDLIKKKVCRYLLQRYLGNFLDEKLSLEQLNVDLYNGKGTVNNVTLYNEALNELCESQGWGIEVTGGRIGSVEVTIPWNALMTDDSYIEVTGFHISIRPRARPTDGTSMFESMWSSMSSSMQLAQECIEKEGGSDITSNAQHATIEGLEKFAQTIDSVLNRIKAKFLDTEIRLEYLPSNSENGVAIIIKIEKLEYQNEAGGDPPDKSSDSEFHENVHGQKTQLISTYAIHHVRMEGITFYTEEFRVKYPKKHSPNTESIIAGEQFYSTISQLPETEQIMASEKLKGTDTESENSESDIEDDKTSKPEITRTEKVMFGKLTNKQEIRIKVKQAENIPGPKVSLELSMGALFIFLSPRQLHMIIAFSNAFFSDDQLEKAEAKSRQQKQHEQRRKEMELQKENLQKRFNAMAGVVGLNQGFWSDPMDDSSNQGRRKSSHGLPDDELRSIPQQLDLESVISSSSSMTSSIGSSSVSSSTANISKIRRKCIDSDPNADISHYNVRIAFLTIVLLHEDVLVEYVTQSGETYLNEQSISKLIMLSDHFFSNCQNVSSGLQTKDIINAGKILDKCCNKNHLRLILTPIILEGEEQRNLSGILLTLNASVARADFREVLQEISVPLIECYRQETRGGLPDRPELKLLVKQTTPVIKGSSGQRFAPPRTEFNFSLAHCLSELDISLFDRLSAIFSTSPFVKTGSQSPGFENTTSTRNNKHGESRTEVKIDSSHVDLRLRFPIADLRPIHDPGRVPWWKQNVRPDFVLLYFQQFRFKYTLPSLIEIEANEIDIYYYENVESQPVHLGKSVIRDNSGSRFAPVAIEYPKISIEFPSEEVLKSLLRKNSDEKENGQTPGDSMGTSFIHQTTTPKDSSPFSSKRACRESDTPHAKQYTDDPETLIIPGDAEEMKTFCENAMKTSKIQINVSLPILSLQINSKHLYEVIYNRITNDLLMWEASAPSSRSPRTTNFSQNMADSLFTAGMMDSIYAPFTNAEQTNLDSSSGSEESENDCDSDNVYFSLYERKRTKRPMQSTAVHTTSSCSFRLNVDQGILTLYAPVRDANNRVIPGQSGEFAIKANSMFLLTVSGYCGNENLAYVCLQAKSAELYHCGLIAHPKSNCLPRMIHNILPSHLQVTLYPTPHNLTLNESKGSAKREMLALAIQIKALPEQRIKRIRVAAGIQNTTLKHNPATSQHTWLNQLIDFFDILDYPIEGYVNYGVVTEMHLHLWDCSIDYRPQYLPYRAVATLGTFMISSNLTSASSGCTLRFVAEDCSLSLAPYEPPNEDKRKSLANKITTLPSKELVCVVELGLFEISLRLNEKATASFPKFDLRASINDIHLRTCSDSGQALAQLIAYLAADGDLNAPQDESMENCELHNMSNKSDEDELLQMRQATHVVPEVSTVQQERVNTLMAEAMQESLRAVPQPEEPEKGVEIFFFPDEANYAPPVRETIPEVIEEETYQLGKQEKYVESVQPDDDTKSVQDDPDTSLSGSGTDLSSNRRASEDTDSVNTELRDLLNFENTVMDTSYMAEDSVVEALPEIKKELGDVPLPVSKGKLMSGGVTRKISSDTDEEFCFIAEEEKAKCAFEEVEVSEEPIRIVDNHFSVPIGKPDLLKAPQGFPMAVMRYTLCEMTLTWHMYGGSDFHVSEEEQKSDRDVKQYIERFSTMPMSEAYKVGVSYSKGSPNVTFGVKKLSKLTWKNRGGLGRKHDVLMQIQISKVRFSHETYPLTTKQASRQVLLVTELEIRDRLQVSKINKFLYHPSVNQRPKKGSQHMVVIKALHLRPNLTIPAQECCLRISLLPLRLNIDQDSLLFMVQFFNELGNAGSSKEEETTIKHGTPTHPPVMMVDDLPEAVQDLEARKMISENLMLLMEDEDKEKEVVEAVNDTLENTPVYFREVYFGPDVPIRLDYHGKRIEMSRGPLAGLLMGLGQLQCSEIRLKKIHHKYGVLGVDRLLNFLFREWLQDIKKNQLPSLLSGVGPMYTLVQLFQGIRDLFWLPIEQYQKDGRIVRGLQLGAQSFTTRTALAALEITTRLIQLLQFTAETAYDMVSPGPSVRRVRYNRKGKRKRMHPPQDIREGVANAYHIVKEGIGETAHNLVEVTAVEHDQKGYTGAVGAVVRQIPPIVVRPIVLATQATTNVLGGVKNQLVPDARIEAREKWKEDED